MFKAIDPVSFACYYSIFEFMQIGKDYFFTIQDMNKLAYNLIHNLGRIYDNVADLIDLFNDVKLDELNWWKKTGYLLGDSVSQVFNKPADYEWPCLVNQFSLPNHMINIYFTFLLNQNCSHS